MYGSGFGSLRGRGERWSHWVGYLDRSCIVFLQ